MRVAPSVPDAIQLATRLAEDADGEAGVLVAGSITLVAEARRHLQETHLPRTVDATLVAAAGGPVDDAPVRDDAARAEDAGEPGNVPA